MYSAAAASDAAANAAPTKLRQRRLRRHRTVAGAGTATRGGSSSDGYDTACDEEDANEDDVSSCPSCGPTTVAAPTPWNSWRALPSASASGADKADAEENGDGGDDEAASCSSSELNCAIVSALTQLEEAQDVMLRLRTQFNNGGHQSYSPDSDTDSNSSCIIRGDARLMVAIELNQSACEETTNQTEDEGDKEARSEAGRRQRWSARKTAQEEANVVAAAEAQPQSKPQPMCEVDVIAQRLNTSLRLLQGGPYQECENCVKTLTSGDQNQLASRELLDRLNNLETMLLYLQFRFRGHMSCSKLKMLCQLKKVISCMHGYLLKQQSEEFMSNVSILHEKLHRTGDFRKNWKPVPPGGEKFRFVVGPKDCQPRVEADDEWLRAFLPESEKACLGHILADTETLVSERLGKRMSYTKGRGRSTRLHNEFTRDEYEDMLRRFQFALMH